MEGQQAVIERTVQLYKAAAKAAGASLVEVEVTTNPAIVLADGYCIVHQEFNLVHSQWLVAKAAFAT